MSAAFSVYGTRAGMTMSPPSHPAPAAEPRSWLPRQILCTVGPSTLAGREIARLTELGVSLFRINLSHTALSALPGVISTIREHTSVPICLDTEGAQIRTGRLAAGRVSVRDQSTLRLFSDPILGDASQLSLYPNAIVHHLKVGNLLSIDFNSVVVQIVERTEQGVLVRVLSGGEIGQNKAVSVLDEDIDMPPLTQKDVDALKLGAAGGIRHVALSFANRASDVDAVRRIMGLEAYVISKIECRTALQNLREIAHRSDALLIDRGDLSRQIPIERIPGIQKAIIRTAKTAGKPIYVATNLLESMISSPTPTRAEVNDIYNTLLDGADGLVLAAETAIGQHPTECADMVLRVIREYARDQELASAALTETGQDALAKPHGADVIRAGVIDAASPDVAALPRIAVSETALIDATQIATGLLSPVSGFMDRHALEHVLDHGRLPDGVDWPAPIVLCVPRETADLAAGAQRLALADAGGRAHAVIDVADVNQPDWDSVLRRWFGSADHDHPGVAQLRSQGDWLVSGRVVLLDAAHAHPDGAFLTPAQARVLFRSRGWTRVIAFATSGVFTRRHEHIQAAAFQATGADGLLVSPRFGPSDGGWPPRAVLRSYQHMVESRLCLAGRVAISALPEYRRYCPKRELLLGAIRAKNMGCTHVLLDPWDADGDTENAARCEEIQKLGIVPILAPRLAWNESARRFEGAGGPHEKPAMTDRQALDRYHAGELLPEWYIRPEIQDLLRSEFPCELRATPA